MKGQQIIIPAKDGYKLTAILREPKAKAKGVVQIHCGGGLPQSLYSNFASFLSENGFVSITFDYRGIGLSKPNNLKSFKADPIDWGELDMFGVLDWCIKKYPEQKKIIAAHSMGGQLVGLMENNAEIDQLFLIASSTGYWKDMSKPFKWIFPPIWFSTIPVHNFIFGYTKVKKLKLGENLPKGVANKWWKWSINKNYFEDELTKLEKISNYDKIKIPLISIQISDDPIANNITANNLLKYYKNAKIRIKKITPKQLGVNKIGHSGFFSRKFKNTLWKNLVTEII
ncbi:MAG: alpha/beta fold hydrolase [Bacteroidota bacterium]